MIGVIFDMDGVLVDNAKVHDEAWQMICEKYGKPRTTEEIKKVFGGTNKVFVNELIGIYDDKKVEAIAKEKEILYREIFDKKIAPPPGLMEFLFDLKKNNVRLAVGTSGPIENLNFVLEKLNIRGFFDELVYEGMFTNGKPDPEVYNLAIQKLGLKAEDCVVIEDSILGIQAGLAAGTKVIGITTSFTADKINIADIIVSSFTEINFNVVRDLINHQ